MATQTARLNDEQVRHYHEKGYVIPTDDVFPEAKFAALRDHFEAKLADWELNSGQRPEAMDTPHFADPKLFDWLFADEVLDLVEPIIGPDIALWSSHFICKPPRTGQRVPWHEDSAYWGTVLEPMEVCTVWLAIDPSTPENGCMRVIPETHGDGYSEYEDVDNLAASVFATRIKQDQFNEDDAVDVVLRPGQASLHHGKIIHGSNPNTSEIRRCGYTMRYMPASVKYRPECRDINGFDIYLARGKDRAGNTYGDPTKPNAAWLAAQQDDQARRRMKSLGH